MRNKRNEKEWELGVKTNSQGWIFVVIRAKNGKQPKQKVIKINGKFLKKNKNHVEGMRNEEKIIAIMKI
jgi:hypothetical protein